MDEEEKYRLKHEYDSDNLDELKYVVRKKREFKYRHDIRDGPSIRKNTYEVSRSADLVGNDRGISDLKNWI